MRQGRYREIAGDGDAAQFARHDRIIQARRLQPLQRSLGERLEVRIGGGLHRVDSGMPGTGWRSRNVRCGCR
ncbi:MAG: hypothetical protein LC715_05190 [Gammaproteobacteria bacterium]|nr:hypothetical protein [Gammaproteobacteria bacterium]